MKQMDWFVWLLLAAVICLSLYNKSRNGEPEGECQAYDQLGHGLGCEGPDITDRL